MSRFKSAIAVLFLCLSTTLFAVGTHGGSTGGGNVVVCKDATTGVSSIRLLDYYEAEILMPELVIDLGAGKTEGEKVEFVLSRLERLDKNRAEDYRKVAVEFMKNTNFVTKVVLPDINDHDYVPLNPDCKIEQVAVQRLSPYPQAKKYTIRKDFWDRLSIDDKAGLILHEVIYEEALGLKQKTSRNSRYFNALISSTKIDKLDLATYLQRLELVGFNPPTPETPWVLQYPQTFQIQTEVPFRANLNEWVLNAGGGFAPVSFDFKMMKGPGWMTVSPTGQMQGLPTKSDVGLYALIINVTDGKRTESMTIKLTVSNGTPFDSSLPEAYVGQKYSADVIGASGYSKTCGNNKITLVSSPVTIPRWSILFANGLLEGTPTAKDEGLFTVKVALQCTVQRTVTETLPNGKTRNRLVNETKTKQFAMSGQVLPGAYPGPLMDPIPLPSMRVGIASTVDLLDGTGIYRTPTIQVKKISGPAWLAVGVGGIATGTPAASDAGSFNLVATISYTDERPVYETLPDGSTRKRMVQEFHTTEARYIGEVLGGDPY